MQAPSFGLNTMDASGSIPLTARLPPKIVARIEALDFLEMSELLQDSGSCAAPSSQVHTRCEHIGVGRVFLSPSLSVGS